MTDTKVITYGELKNGDKIYLQGKLFEVHNIRLVNGYNGKVIRFNGYCTPDNRNNDIRKSMYNGGTYGAYTWVTCTIAIN